MMKMMMIFVIDDEDLIWSVVSEAVGAEEPCYTTRGVKACSSAKNNKGKGITSSSTQGKRHGLSPSHLELVDEDTRKIWSLRKMVMNLTKVFICF